MRGLLDLKALVENLHKYYILCTQFIDRVDNGADQNDGEEQSAAPSEQTANNDDTSSNYQAPETGDSISKTSSDTRSLNLPT